MPRECPFCINPIHDEATVCGSCGAYESTPAKERDIGIFMSFVLVTLLFILVPAGIIIGLAKSVLAGFFVSMVLPFAIFKGLMKLTGHNKKFWYRGRR